MKKRFVKIVIGLLIALTLVSGCVYYAFFIEPNRLVINRQTMEISGLHKAFDGLKLALISDIHAGSSYIDEAKLREIVEVTNKQKPDMIILLGDYVSIVQTGTNFRNPRVRMPLDVIRKNLNGLKARYGVFAILGNQDFWYSSEEVYDAFENIGINVLEQESARITINGSPLTFLGFKDQIKISDMGNFFMELEGATTGGQDEQVIVLTHSPDMLYLAAWEKSLAKRTKLILAGHTHGGQFWLPIIGSPFTPSNQGSKYAYGKIRDRNLDMYVTTGIGTSIYPFRFLVPPEIVILTLRSDM